MSLEFGSLPSGVEEGSPNESEIDITDDDVCVSFGSSSYSVDEGSRETVRVRLSEAPGRILDIPVRVSPGTDVAVTFGSNSDSATFTYTASRDDDCDDETVSLTFGSLPSGVEEDSPDESEIAITDDDVCVRFGSSSYSVDEGSRETVRVRLSEAPGRILDIPVDVAGTTRTVRFGSNSRSETFDYSPSGDDDCDDETVSLSFGSLPSGVEEGSPDESEITVTDGDACVSFDSASYSVIEGSSVEVEVNRAGNASGSLGIPISVTLGSAESGDYTVSDLPGGILWFGGGDGSATFTIKANQDDFDCEDETIEVGFGTLPPDVNAPSPSSATVTIDDDDACAPDKVVNLRGAPGSVHGEIALTWDAASGATGYEVRQKKPRPILPDEWIALPADGFEVEIVGTTATVRNLDPDTTYEHQVRGVNVHGEGEWSDSVETAPRDERPATPTGLVRGAIRGGRGVSLQWNAVAGPVGYEVDVSPMESPQRKVVSGSTAAITVLVPDRRYGFRVRSWNLHGASRLYSPWTDAVYMDAPEPSYWDGHQEDHTVAYQVGTMPSTPPGLPAGVPDPAVVIPAAIDPAANAWTTAAMAIAGKNLNICKVSACGGNHDGGIITVTTASAKTNATGAISHDPSEGCGPSVACVKLGIPSSSTPSSNGLGNHLMNLWAVIEEPAWECRDRHPVGGVCSPALNVRVYWTDQSGKDREPILNLPPGIPYSEYYYIGATMTHEFGHTFGLPDFGEAHPTLQYWPAVMGNSHDNKAITDEDIEQLRAIYALHESINHE